MFRQCPAAGQTQRGVYTHYQGPHRAVRKSVSNPSRFIMEEFLLPGSVKNQNDKHTFVS